MCPSHQGSLKVVLYIACTLWRQMPRTLPALLLKSYLTSTQSNVNTLKRRHYSNIKLLFLISYKTWTTINIHVPLLFLRNGALGVYIHSRSETNFRRKIHIIVVFCCCLERLNWGVRNAHSMQRFITYYLLLKYFETQDKKNRIQSLSTDCDS